MSFQQQDIYLQETSTHCLSLKATNGSGKKKKKKELQAYTMLLKDQGFN